MNRASTWRLESGKSGKRTWRQSAKMNFMLLMPSVFALCLRCSNLHAFFSMATTFWKCFAKERVFPAELAVASTMVQEGEQWHRRMRDMRSAVR